MIPLIMSYKSDYEISPTQLLTNTKEKDAYHVACAVMAECDYFDYTLWQREYFDKMESGEFAAKASAYADSHPFTGKAQIL